MTNIRAIRRAASAHIEIKDPADGTPTGVRFEIAGPEHPERKRIAFAQSRRTLKRYEKTGRFEMPDPEEAEASKLENLAAFTLGWENFVDDQGKDVPFSRATALELYSDPEMGWLVEQVEAALGDRELFIRRSAIS